ncbi:MAG: amino acid adenylation domain-containing protein [Pseudomonadota bacterium]
MPDQQPSASGTAAKGPIEDVYPLTDMQHGILVRCVSYPDQPVYMGQWWAEIQGALDEQAFADAWNVVVERHTALRSAFHWELKDQPFQVVHRQAPLSVEMLDWSASADWRHDLQVFLKADREKIFDLKRPPLMRVRLVRLADDRHVIIWTRHHLVVDGWSLGVILDEVFTAYRALKDSQSPVLGGALPFRSYVDWDKGRDSASALAHWRDVLAGFDQSALAAGELATAADLAELVETVDEQTTTRLLERARDARLTPNTLVQGAWALVLSRLVGRDDVLFGSVETQRPAHLLDDGAATLVGPQIAVLPVRAKLDNTPLGDWLAELQAAMVAGRDAGGVGLDAIREIIDQPRDALPFESLVGFQNYPLDESKPLKEAGLSVIDSADISLPDMPLNLMVETGDSMTLRLIVDRRRHTEDQAGNTLAMLATALHAVADGTAGPVNEIDVLPEDMTRRLLDVYAGNVDLDVPEPVVPDLILRHAQSTPSAVALRYGQQAITYQQLAGTACGIAEQIGRAEEAANRRIGVMMDRSPTGIAALVGVMLAGAAYVPLDPEGSSGRRDRILSAAGIDTVVTSSDYADQFPHCRVVLVDGMANDVKNDIAPTLPSSDDEAYVIFTSGSTGEPKGVIVGQDNLRYHVAARAAAYPDQPVDTFLLTFPIHFDGSVTVIFSTLATGGTLVLPEPVEATDPERLAALIKSAGVTHTDMIPSMWSLVLEAAEPVDLASIRLALVAAEPCPRDLVAAHDAKLPGVPLYNEYGPTETTVWATLHRCEPSEHETTVPIGRPIPGTRVYLLDSLGRLSPPSSIGELTVAGPAVARGYIGADEATAAKFTPNSFASDPVYASAYRTGDLAAFDPDGQLAFHGRADHQVKVNGHRIELGEIEACLASHPDIKEAVVVVRQDGDRPAHLVAHIAGADLPEADDLRQYTGGHLPAYMVPNVMVRHDRLPRTVAGKVDRTQLPAPIDETPAAPPEGERERALATIWQDALGRPEISRHDDFFALGGTSLIAMQVVSRIRRDLKVNADLLDLFEEPEIALLAARLEAREPADAGSGAKLTQRRRTHVDLSTVAGPGASA